MKPSLNHLLSTVLLLLPLTALGEDPKLTDFSISGGQAHLQWEGGAPPFDVEASANLLDWTRVLQTLDSSASAPIATSDPNYFRIRSEQTVPGRHLGQLRVDEGEFGGPLARHRLKSLWDFYRPEGEVLSRIPKTYFQQLTLRLIYRDGDVLQAFTGKLGDLPGARITTESKAIKVTWTFGSGIQERIYSLDLAFSYDINLSRTTIHLSDPRYTLTCRYAVSQPEEGYDNGRIIEETMEDSVSLYQISEEPTPDWLSRAPRFRVGTVTFSTQYDLGLPLFGGSPTFIWKTPILNQWGKTTIVGLTSVPLVITDRFTQTYQPGHHNFVEHFWIEPALIPGLTAELREELREADIRFIVVTHPSAFPSSPSTIQLVGFDLKVRD